MRAFILLCIMSWTSVSPVAGQDKKAWNAILEKFDQGKIYAGIRRAEKELSGKQPDRSFLILRADGSNRIGEYARAVSDAKQAIEHVSDTLLQQAYLQLGIAMIGTGKPDSARFFLEKALDASGNGEALLRLGRMDLVAGERDRALERFNQLLAADPDHVKALLERGAAHASMGDTAAARKDLDRAVDLAPRDPVAWNSRGFHVHASKGDHARAIVDYDRAIKLDPNYSFAFNNRGWSLYKLGDVKKARKNIALAARKRGSNPYVFRNLGVIALETGEKEQACAYFSKALTLNFEQLHGTEVSDLVREHCMEMRGEPSGTDRVPDPEPDVVPPRSNAPGRGNAP